VLKIGRRMIRRSHFCEHRMNSWEEENKCISTRWSGGTIGWLVGSSYAFSGNIQRGIRAKMASTRRTDAKNALMLMIFPESCGEFHKLSNKYKVAQNGVRSRELWPKYRRAATWVTGWTSGTVGATSVIRRWKIGQILRIIPEYCVEFHNLSNEYKLVEYGVRSKEIRAKYGRAYGSTGRSDAT
jgi:hypothetical protein